MVPRAIVRDYFDERESVRMLSMLMLVMGMAPILAPLIGGQLLLHLGWRSVFWVLAAYGAVWFVLAALLLPESLPRERRRREPIAGVLAVYQSLLRDRRYMGYVATGGFILAGLLAYIAGSPFVFIELFQVPPERYGVYFGANAAGIIAASQVNRWLALRLDPGRVVRLMLPISVTAATALLVSAATGLGGFGGILVPLFCFIATHGFVMPNTSAMAMAPNGAVAGSASALMGTVQFMMGAAAGTLVGASGNGSAVPLGVVLTVCATGAVVVFYTIPPRVPVGVRDTHGSAGPATFEGTSSTGM